MARKKYDEDDDDYRDDEEEDYAPPVKKRKRSRPSGGAGDFFMFRTFITPWLVIIIFWIGVVGVEIAAVLALVGSFNAPMMSAKIMGILMALVMMVLGPLAVRLYCELIIIIFRLYETTVEVRDELRSQG